MINAATALDPNDVERPHLQRHGMMKDYWDGEDNDGMYPRAVKEGNRGRFGSMRPLANSDEWKYLSIQSIIH
jgi:hypothetical protein